MSTSKNFASMSDPIQNPGFRRHWIEPPHSKNSSVIGSAVADLVGDMRFRQMVEHIHGLGARAIAELLAEIAVKHSITAALHETLERYTTINPETLRALGGDKFSPAPLREIRAAS